MPMNRVGMSCLMAPSRNKAAKVCAASSKAEISAMRRMASFSSLNRSSDHFRSANGLTVLPCGSHSGC